MKFGLFAGGANNIGDVWKGLYFDLRFGSGRLVVCLMNKSKRYAWRASITIWRSLLLIDAKI